MAIHPDTSNLLRESLPEFLQTAEHCIAFRKGSAEWGPEQAGGCFGYPGASLLFAIADTIGSFHRGRADFEVQVDGRPKRITSKGFQHLRVFNSGFYGLNLSGRVIRDLYSKYRNLLVHNASLAPEHFLFLGAEDDEPFPLDGDRVMVNVAGFLRISRGAVEDFLAHVDDIVPGSRQEDDINRRA